MFLLGPRPQSAGESNVWTASADFCARPDEVLEALTDPELIAQWAPISFNVVGLTGERLTAGTRARVSGNIAGLGASFEVKVSRADTRRLELSARGPVAFEVTYIFLEHEDGVTVEARVLVRREAGLAAQVVRTAASALLNAGALAGSLRRIESSLQPNVERQLVAA
jgi:uncharacterized protein YndB with AHSA1/START domain